MRLDMSPENDDLWGGCRRSSFAGKPNVETEPTEAIRILRRNLVVIFSEVHDRREIILGGAMAAWAYLVVFDVASKIFGSVYYSNKYGKLVLITQRDH
ncbi:hypothetical protein UFOVP829_32 [uncultured Caudovirales phage]|uniref:Uncharacterized protein n=1 Tax=uncultured Caudovirales phage TaxID=2100421 RepID=A0A6J5ML34_9CAUD|nr:hypothetical protein UFOVP493_10 [uncultured Caudovirales phage]CAB4164373.1 hypothetical protein UFOVP829_32 [uncultured Caudovirales phage]CAB4177776.1 hypothetical protein UFOVP1003_48 [uncultured Caudovirales phage]CAB4187315.1 hypothetical protein UFOVP1153_10 [uncultured Caudovirales phage]